MKANHPSNSDFGDPEDTSRRVLTFTFLVGGSVICGSIGLITFAAAVSSMMLYRLVQDNQDVRDRALKGALQINVASNHDITSGEIRCYVIAAVLLLVSFICGILAARENRCNPRNRSPQERYDRHLVGVGYALTLLAIINFVAIAGFCKVGQLPQILTEDFTSTTNDGEIPLHRVLFLLLAPGFAALGALFFHANSLRAKRERLGPVQPDNAPRQIAELPPNQNPKTDPDHSDPLQPVVKPTADAEPPKPDDLAASKTNVAAEGANKDTVLKAAATATILRAGEKFPEKVQMQMNHAEPFDAARFWGGLWFRVGEALLFTLVVFLFGGGASLGKLTGASLLLGSLLLGMFVKTGEGLISGIADKLFSAVKELVK
jgi:hypothetical protein